MGRFALYFYSERGEAGGKCLLPYLKKHIVDTRIYPSDIIQIELPTYEGNGIEQLTLSNLQLVADWDLVMPRILIKTVTVGYDIWHVVKYISRSADQKDKNHYGSHATHTSTIRH